MRRLSQRGCANIICRGQACFESFKNPETVKFTTIASKFSNITTGTVSSVFLPPSVAEEHLLKGQFLIIWFDASNIVGHGGIEGLHEQVKRAAELGNKVR